MADPSVFANMYLLQVDEGGNFVIVDGNGNSGDGLTPATQDVTIKDDIQDGATDVHATVGDIANDRFHVTRADSLNGAYTFVSLGQTVGDNGFIARNETTGAYYFFTNAVLDNSQANTALTLAGGELPVCFMPGTMIRTPAGETRVEELAIGDAVTTADGRSVAIRWIGRQTVAPAFADQLRLPIRVRANAIADNVPSRDLLLSPDHALMVDGLLIHAGALVNGISIVRESNVPAMFTYYHIETDDHSLILADNAPAETFIDNVDRMRFDNWAEYEALYPEPRQMAEMTYPRAKALRQVPPALRARLAERAAGLGNRIARAA